MLVQVTVLGRRGQSDTLLGHEDAAANVLAAHLYRPLLVGSHQDPQHLIERDKAQVS